MLLSKRRLVSLESGLKDGVKMMLSDPTQTIERTPAPIPNPTPLGPNYGLGIILNTISLIDDKNNFSYQSSVATSARKISFKKQIT